jgi:hypothetical protein
MGGLVKAFREAFFKAFAEGAGAIQANLGDSLYAFEAPCGKRLPYAVLSIPVETEESSFTSVSPELSLQLDVYAADFEAVEALALDMRQFVDETEFSVPGYAFVAAEFQQTTRFPGAHAQRITVEYLITLHRAA